jgi:hypothetical protein
MKYHKDNNDEPCSCGCTAKREIQKRGESRWICLDCYRAQCHAAYVRQRSMGKRPAQKHVRSEAARLKRANAEGGAGYADRIMQSIGDNYIW